MATAYASIRDRRTGTERSVVVTGDRMLITDDVKRELSRRCYGDARWVLVSVLFPGTAEVSK